MIELKNDMTKNELLASQNSNNQKAWRATPIGVMSIYPVPYSIAPPQGYLDAIGQNVSRTTYAELFALYGTTHGAGNGTTTFTLPDMRKRAAVGFDPSTAPYNVVGNKIGSETQALRAAIGAINNNLGALSYKTENPIPDVNYNNGYGVVGTPPPASTGINHSTLVKRSDGAEPSTLSPSLVTRFIIAAL